MRTRRFLLDAATISERGDEEDWLLTCDLASMPDPTRYSFQTAISLIRKYRLPCDVHMRELRPNLLAAHGWRRDGTCAVAISNHLNFKGDKRAIRRRIVHELAHHIAGRGHNHDEVFKRIAAELYDLEGYPRGIRGEGWGNI